MEDTKKTPKNGLLGYYFEKTNFQKLLFISNGVYTDTNVKTNSHFIKPEQTVQAVRWLGRIKPLKTGMYIFSTSDDENVVLQINGSRLVINQNKRHMIHLQANEFYKIRLEYYSNTPLHIKDVNLSFYWYLAKNKIEKIPETAIFLPDFTKGLEIQDLSSTLFGQEVYFDADNGVDCDLFEDDPACKKGAKPKPEPKPKPKPKPEPKPEPIHDSDNDGIPDNMEISGYTVSHVLDESGEYFKVYPWLEEYNHDPQYYNHYPKYVSNPYMKNTVGDPYTDLEKAGQSIYIKGKILEEAYHPLVAACPSVSVFLEKAILIPKEEIEKKQTNGVSFQTNYGIENTNTVGEGISSSAGADLEFGGNWEREKKEHGKKINRLSGKSNGGIYRSTHLTNYNEHISTTISTIQETKTQSIEEQKTIHSMDSAVLSGVIRYTNMGTAPMSDVQPSISFVVGENPVTSFRPVNTVNNLEPGKSYPSIDEMGTIVAPKDLFNGHPTSIDLATKNRIFAGSPIKIETPQIAGTFIGTGGVFPKDSKQQWATILPNVIEKTARLILETPGEILDRRVAAPSKDNLKPNKANKESFTPHLTLEQAIEIAFGARKNNRGDLVMTTQKGMTYKLDRFNVNVYMDKKTDELIVEQLKGFIEKGDNTKSVYDVTLTKEMVILIKPILEVNAFLNNNYLYIENETDESLSYSIWRESGSSSVFLKKGIIPPNFTIGTGYLCGNPDEELYISVAKRVSQIIFKGKVSNLTGFGNNNLKSIGNILRLSPIMHSLTWTRNPKVTDFRNLLFEKATGSTFCKLIKINSQYNQIELPLYMIYCESVVSWETMDWYQNPSITIEKVYYEYTIDTVKTTNTIPTELNRKNGGSYYPNFIAPNQYWNAGNPPNTLIPISTQKDGKFPVKLKLDLYGTIGYENYTENLKKGLVLLFSTEIDFEMLKSKSYDEKKTIPSSNTEQLTQSSFPVSFYQQSKKIYLFNKSSQPVSYCILNEYKESVWEGTLESNKSTEFTFEALAVWKNTVYQGDKKFLSNRIIITINQIPIFDGMPEDVPLKDQMLKYFQEATKLHEIDYWHMNSNANTSAYDSVCFKKIEPKFLSAVASYEVKVGADGESIGVKPTRVPELDGKIIINFFDYIGDTSKHPKKGQKVEIIARDVFGNPQTVFKGTAEVSVDLWKQHYKVSECHRIGDHFDALYLSPVPTGLTESVKSYDIHIGTNKYESVYFERQDNSSYIRSQRLKLDFVKNRIPKEKLPKLGDSIALTIHTVENQTVTIDLGKVKESQDETSINALEEVHEITNWLKGRNDFTSLQFNKGSEHITSYVLKVNNRYYGEIPVSKVTTDLKLANLNNKKKIQKGDYVEIYAYKKDGEGVLIQSRYAGTTGFIGTYPTTDNIKQAIHITNWAKENDRYATFSLNIADSIDSYIKKYEGCINNHIIDLTPKGLTFAFDADKEPRHGDIVQLFAYTYSGDKIELFKLPAGATGPVNDEEVRSIYEVKGWEDTNQTIVFNTSDLQDCIQAYIQSYTIEVWNKSQTKWETFGKPIQMNEKGQLRLQDCKASQPMPQPPNFIRVQTNFFDSERKPVVVMIRIVGEIKKPPTEKEMKDAHTGLVWNFEGEQLKSITFPHVNLALANYISSYRVNKWANVIPEKSTFTVETDGLTLVFEKPIDIASMHEVAVGGGRKESQLVKDEFSAVVYWMNIEGRQLIETLVIGAHVGKTDVKGVVPVRSMSTGDIVKAHQIDSWIFTYDQKQVEGFALRQMPEPILAQIDYYTVVLDEKEFPMPDYSHYKGKMKEQKTLESEPDAKTKKGYVFRFDAFQIPYANHPKLGNEITIKANLVGGSNLIVIDKKKIELE
ncbi:TPA: hypothetical protein QCW13_005017 [Bacillus cereus]|uniref:binary toxin-like calcium binding domain-containing protein n=1 Tax=Bacillus cereus TaxID=1396 RepID=UPI003312A984|nr:PA14 domain-containing protein [Bacillus cereus]HDR7002359.1 hypothetical protein [Bacillus cereus]HDR7020841.1 hypothetical protein [Bacillus cereus]